MPDKHIPPTDAELAEMRERGEKATKEPWLIDESQPMAIYEDKEGA